MDITLPQYDETGAITGWMNYSYAATSSDIVGGPGKITKTPFPADWDPREHHDFEIVTNPERDQDMMELAEELVLQGPNYNISLIAIDEDPTSTCGTVTGRILGAGGVEGNTLFPPRGGISYPHWLETTGEVIIPLDELPGDDENNSSQLIDAISGGGN